MNYFAPAPTAEESVLRVVKGNYRRQFVRKSMEEDGVESVPPAWKEHNLSEVLLGFLGGQHPRARGGEDLPDLDDGEVEIARMTLVDSVHGEVTSLRARLENDQILYRMVDEYGTEIDLPYGETKAPLTAEQVIEMFRDCEPNQTSAVCKVKFQSFFYGDLDEVAANLEAK